MELYGLGRNKAAATEGHRGSGGTRIHASMLANQNRRYVAE